MAIVKLTQDFINNNLQCPEGLNRIEYVSDERTGLYVEVRASSQGQGAYYLRYKDAAGKSCHQKIGRTIDMSIVDAKQKAKVLKAEIQLGADPRAEDKAQKAVLTFDEFFYVHYLPYVKQRNRSYLRSEELYRLRVADIFGTKRLNQITRQQIQTFSSKLIAEGLAPATVNHHQKLIRHMLNVAQSWLMIDSNPASRIPMFVEDNKKERYLTEAELARLLEVLRTDHHRSVCLIAMFLLFTGARLNEALSATWSQIDKERCIWRIPSAVSKSKKMRPVPLNQSAMDVINQLDTEGKYEHLFINRKTKNPYVNIAKIWCVLREKAGLPNLRCHDLRHMAASNLINTGASLYIVQQILGHSDPSVTQRYAHLSIKSLQDASNNANSIISSAMQVKPKPEVAAVE